MATLLIMAVLSVVAAAAPSAAKQSAATKQPPGMPGETISQTVMLAPSKDNTLYESELGTVSNGMGQYLFAGNTGNGEARRAVIAFDLSAIPANATVLSATLSLTVSKTKADETAVSLHVLQQDWGEGESAAVGEEGGGATAEPGDATWLFTFYNTADWATPGGDFDATALATTPVGGDGRYDWTSAEFLADVQAKVANPSGNFGWLLLGDESLSTTAKRFDSAQNEVEADRPVLTLTYEAEPVEMFATYAPVVLTP